VALMTGLNNKRNYTRFAHLDPKQRTFGHFFKDAGYATCVVGKWQLGKELEGPGLFGFEENCLWQLIRRPGRYRNPGLEINGKEVDFKQNEYGPDIVNDYALDFVTRKKDQPFFLYYPMMLTHSPYDATPDSPDYLTAKSEDGTKKIGHFPDMVAYTDKLIGKLVAKLEELKLRENTLIVIMGDNGTGGGTPSRFKGRDVTGGKGSSLVWGTHVPGIANWPGQLASGKVCADMIEAADMLPTICEAAQVPLPTDLKLDGRSFLPQLRGEKGNSKDALYVWYNPSGGAKAQYEFAHEARYKLYADGRLFDTVADDREKSPLKDAELSAEAKAARAKLQAVLDANKGPRDEYFVRQTEAFGGEAGGKKAKAAKKASKAAPKAEADPRAARFKERDPDHDGKITYEEFQSSMTDKKIAKERFETRDLNKDGSLSLEEFLATLPAAK
jgi:arylsulfatase A